MKAGWVAIANPASGGGLTRTAMFTLERRLGEVAERVVTTQYRGHATEVAAQCEDAAGFVVAGGDGTLLEVLQALRRDRQQAALVPMGRGNSLARDLGVVAPKAARSWVHAGAGRRIDLLDVAVEFEDGRRWRGVSASNLALGYPAAVVQLATNRFGWSGRHGYTLASAITRPTVVTCRMSYDNGPAVSLDTTGLIISNSRHIGPFEAFPDADMADGLCDVMELRSGWGVQNLHNLSVLTRWHGYCPAVVRRAGSVSVELDAPGLVKIDGDLRSDVRRVEVAVLPSALTCRVPGIAHA